MSGVHVDACSPGHGSTRGQSTAFGEATPAMTQPPQSPLPPSPGVQLWEVQPEHGGKPSGMGSPAGPHTTADLFTGMHALGLDPAPLGNGPLLLPALHQPQATLCRQYFLQAGMCPQEGVPPSPCAAATLHTPVRGRRRHWGRHNSHFQLPSDKTPKPKHIRSCTKTPVINSREAQPATSKQKVSSRNTHQCLLAHLEPGPTGV